MATLNVPRPGGGVQLSRDEHEGIMLAIAQGDGEEASRRMRAHLLNAATAIGSYIAAHSAVD